MVPLVLRRGRSLGIAGPVRRDAGIRNAGASLFRPEAAEVDRYREIFGKDYARQFVASARQRGLDGADMVATATAFTARTIADGYRRHVFPVCRMDEVIVSGGGAHNRTLLAMLERLLPELKVLTSGALGVSDDAKEAVIFALLGNDFMHGLCNNLPSATGAERPTVMGKLAFP